MESVHLVVKHGLGDQMDLVSKSVSQSRLRDLCFVSCPFSLSFSICKTGITITSMALSGGPNDTVHVKCGAESSIQEVLHER